MSDRDKPNSLKHQMDSLSDMISKMVTEQVKTRMEAEVKSRVEAEVKTRMEAEVKNPADYFPSNSAPGLFNAEQFMKIAFVFNGETDLWTIIKLAYQSSPHRFSVYGTPHANFDSPHSDAPQKVTVRWTLTPAYFVPIHFYGKMIHSGKFIVEEADIVLRRGDPPVYLGTLNLAKQNWKTQESKITGAKSSVSE